MALDPVKNFAIVTVSTGYDADDTSIELTAGHGARLPLPSSDGAFNLVWWNDTDYSDPSDDPNVEIVRVTARATDTLTVTRAQESTTGATHNTAAKVYKMVLAVTKKMIDDIETQLDAAGDPWVFQYIPSETVNGSNAVFTLPDASQVIVYADGSRVRGGGVDYTFSSDDTITFVTNAQPFSTISIDYLPL